MKDTKNFDTELEISQCVGDTALLLEGNRNSYENLSTILDDFAKMPGLKLNYDKTCNVWLGSKGNREVKYLAHLNMISNAPEFKILGLWFTDNLAHMSELNVAHKVNETKNKLFSICSKIIDSLLKRVAILKNLILSKLIYIFG